MFSKLVAHPSRIGGRGMLFNLDDLLDIHLANKCITSWVTECLSSGTKLSWLRGLIELHDDIQFIDEV
jgi:hypothetical protein